MPITDPILRKKLLDLGYDPDNSQLASETPPAPVAQQNPTKTQESSSMMGAGLRSLRNAFPSATGALAAGAGAAALSAPLAAIPVAGPFIPPAIGIGTALATGMGLRKLQDEVVLPSILSPETLAGYQQQQIQDRETQPVASTVGEIAASGPFVAPSLKALPGAVRAIANPLRGVAPAAADLGNLANVGIGAAVPTGIRYASDPEVTPLELLAEAIGGGLMNKTTKLGEKLLKLKPDTYRSNPLEGDLQEDLRTGDTVKATGPRALLAEKNPTIYAEGFERRKPLGLLTDKQPEVSEPAKTEAPTQRKLLKAPEVTYPPFEEGVTKVRQPSARSIAASQLQSQDMDAIPPKYQEEGDTLAELNQQRNEPILRKLESKGLPTRPTTQYADKMKRLGEYRGVKITDTKRVFKQDGTEVSGESLPRRGLEDAESNINPEKAGLDTYFHEIQHPTRQDRINLGSKSDQKFEARSEKITELSDDYAKWKAAREKAGKVSDVDEYITTIGGEDTVRRTLKLDGGEFKNWLRDVKSNVKMKVGLGDTKDVARMQSNRLVNDPSFAEQYKGEALDIKAKDSGETKNQDESGIAPAKKPDYYLETSDFLKNNKSFSSDRIINGEQLLNTIKNKYPTEFEILKGMGLSEFVGRGKVPKDVAKWIDENGPKIEVKSLDAIPKVKDSPEEQRYNQLSHEFYDALGQTKKEELDDIWYRNRDDVNAFRNELIEKGWTDNPLDTATEYFNLGVKLRDNDRYAETNNDSATAKYQMVNPKPLKDMEGAVDLLVRIPTPTGEEGIRARSQGKGLVKFQADKTHYPKEGNNLLAHVRGNMETLPDGKRVFHVFEMQSDWAQQIRKEEDRFNQVRDYDNGVESRANKQLKTANDPLLKHYERLAIKAAINHARKQGADYIALSDAETAMITEGHDKAAQRSVEIDPAHEPKARDIGLTVVKDGDKVFVLDNHAGISELKRILYADNIKTIGDETQQISQEKGMRLHYDQTLPKILSELTGQKGERVEFGEHQNAFGKKRESGTRDEWTDTSDFRDDLIFKNPDGTPKTNISARMYPLKEVAEPLSMLNKRYQDESGIKSESPYKKQIQKIAEEGKVKSEEFFKNLYKALPADHKEMVSYDTFRQEIMNSIHSSKQIRREFDGIIDDDSLNESVGAMEKLETTSGLLDKFDRLESESKNKEKLSKNQDESGIKYSDDDTKGAKELSANPAKVKKQRSASIPVFRPEIDKIRSKEGPEAKVAADAMTKFFDELGFNRGNLVNDFQLAVRKLVGLDGVVKPLLNSPKNYLEQDSPVLKSTLQKMYDTRDGKQGIVFSAEEQKVRTEVQRILKKVRDEQRKRQINDRNLEDDPNYIPHTSDYQVIKSILENPNSIESKRLKNEFIEYQKAKLMARKLTSEEALKQATTNLDTMLKGYGSKDIKIASQFGPIDKAEGLGLPNSWREKNLLNSMQRYLDRTARRFAYHDSIETTPGAKDAIELLKGDAEGPVATVINAIEGIQPVTERKRMAIMGVVRAGNLGPLTGVRDFAANFTLGMQHHGDPVQTVRAAISALGSMKENLADAYKTGRIRTHMQDLEWSEMSSVLSKVRDVLSDVQGRNWLEQQTRAVAMGMGKFTTLDFFEQLRKGKPSSAAKKWFDDFGEGIDLKKGTLSKEDLNRIAARYVDSVQGTYDYRGLPKIAMEGSYAPVFSLARWSIEKSNNFTKNVVNPLLNGNPRPFLMSTLGMIVGGAAITELTEAITGRREKTPKVSEIQTAAELGEDTKMAWTYKALGLATSAGYMGMMADVMKGIADKVYGKNKPRWYNNILLDVVNQTANTVGSAYEAAAEEGMSAELAMNVAQAVIEDNLQAYRLIYNKMNSEKKDAIEDSNKMTDLRVFKTLTNEDVTDYSTSEFSDSFKDKDLDTFKETSDINEAAELLPDLVSSAFEKAGDNPEKLKKELIKIKRNSYQTMPNPESMPYSFARYLIFLKRTKGEEAAQERLMDYLTQNSINKAKSEMVP
jgi:hypothetical protein